MTFLILVNRLYLINVLSYNSLLYLFTRTGRDLWLYYHRRKEKINKNWKQHCHKIDTTFSASLGARVIGTIQLELSPLSHILDSLSESIVFFTQLMTNDDKTYHLTVFGAEAVISALLAGSILMLLTYYRSHNIAFFFYFFLVWDLILIAVPK